MKQYATGTTTSVSNDDVITPPITAWPIGARCSALGVQVLTLYTFSIENWQRPAPIQHD